jgi:hypothetical protein
MLVSPWPARPAFCSKAGYSTVNIGIAAAFKRMAELQSRYREARYRCYSPGGERVAINRCSIVSLPQL